MIPTLKTTAEITACVLVVNLALLIVFDLFLAANGTPGDTISEVTREAAHRHPIIPCAVGILIGHFFW